jgi:hypothetical protein
MALIGGIKEKEMKHCFYVRHRNGGWVNSPEVAMWIVGLIIYIFDFHLDYLSKII